MFEKNVEAARPLLVVVTGLPGAGKTTTVETLSDEFVRADIPNGSIDLDQIAQIHPMPGATGIDLMFENLAAVWPNYASRGARALIVAWLIEEAEQLGKFRAAVPGCELVIVRVDAPQDELDSRLEKREYGEWIPKLQALTRTLRNNVENSVRADIVVVNSEKTKQQLGAEIFAALGLQGLL